MEEESTTGGLRKKPTPFESHLKDVQKLLRRIGIPLQKLHPGASLSADLKLYPHDYYFLKLDIENMVHHPIDIDEIYECRVVGDLVDLLEK